MNVVYGYAAALGTRAALGGGGIRQNVGKILVLQVFLLPW